MRSTVVLFLLCSHAVAITADVWLARTAPAMASEEKRGYERLTSETERRSFREAFWRGKNISQAEYESRVSEADGRFGSGKEGSGANTDQGRMYIANGAPLSIHRLPSSRIFVESEVWYYESLPGTNCSSRLQFLFYRKNGVSPFRLYSPQINSVRDLLIPQPGTRSMFPVNDIVTTNDLRARLKFSPGEEEIVDAAIGVARGVTGVENDEVISRAMSVSYMLSRQADRLTPSVESRLVGSALPFELRTLQYWTDDVPVVDIQVRIRAASSIGIVVEDRGMVVEQSEMPLSAGSTRSVLYTHRLFLLPGDYQLWLIADGKRTGTRLRVSADRSAGLTGDGITAQPDDIRIAITPDPHSADARRTIAYQLTRRSK